MDKIQKYAHLMGELKNQILTSQIQPGEKLPSENELARDYQTSRYTVRRALALLQEQGLIYTVHGKGTFCCESVRHFKKSKNIAVITTYLSSYIFAEIIQGIDKVMTEAGYSIILKNTKNSRKREADYLAELLGKEIDGLIIEPSKSQIFCRHLHLYEKLDEYKIPYVFIQGCFQQLRHKPHILMDDCDGGYKVTQHLITEGRKDIIGIFKADDAQGQQRHKGYVQALQEAGLRYDPDKVIWFYTEDRMIHPYEELKNMAEKRTDFYFDSVVCYNDQIAIEAIRALQEVGLHVPQDIAVTGYDNSYLAKNGRVPLTTVIHPQERLGEMAASVLISLMQDGSRSSDTQTIMIPAALIVRESTKQRSPL